MGRKKIEIRPLTDERNRNVTFLKRKAGLMKKAWELSVLCAADVSIVIFSAAGKAYEFSSKELDSELDRYKEYEGMIERRRAPEFEAMALADDDDDEDEDDIRPSKSGKNGNLPSGRSLKGKETYKTRSQPLSSAKGKSTSPVKQHRRRDEEVERKPSFIDGILSERSRTGSGSRSSGESPSVDEVTTATAAAVAPSSPRTASSSRQPKPSTSGLQYAFELHSQRERETFQQTYGSSSTSTFPPAPLPPNIPPIAQPMSLPPGAWNFRVQSHYPQPIDIPQLPTNFPWVQQQNVIPPQISHAQQWPSSFPVTTSQPALLPNNMQWDANLLARYAEFQLQQNHQRQQRALLEKQRQQLAELGVPVEDRSLLDELFGTSSTATSSSTQRHEVEEKRRTGDETFIWPTFNASVSGPTGDTSGGSMIQGGMGMLTDLAASGSGSRQHNGDSREGFDWTLDDEMDLTGRSAHLPSPASAGNGMGDKGKRDKDWNKERRESDKRVRIG